MQRNDLQQVTQNGIKQKKSKTNERMHSFKEKCISSCLLILLTVGPMISFAKPARAYSSNEGQGAITTEVYGMSLKPSLSYNLYESQGEKRVQLNWNKIPSAVKYTIVRINLSTGDNQTVNDVYCNPPGYSFDVIPGNSYKFIVVAYDKYLNSGVAEVSTGTISGPNNNYNQPSQPQQPSNYYPPQQQYQQSTSQIDRNARIHLNYELINNNTAIRLRWNEIHSAVKYMVGLRDINTNQLLENKSLQQGTNNYTFAVVPGHTYNASIDVEYPDTTSIYDEAKNISIPSQPQQPQPVPQQPVYNPPPVQVDLRPSLSYDIVGNTVKLKWNNVSSAVRYEVVKSGYNPINNQQDLEDNHYVYSNEYTLNVVPGYRYTFTVLAYDSKNCSGRTELKDVLIQQTQQTQPQQQMHTQTNTANVFKPNTSQKININTNSNTNNSNLNINNSLLSAPTIRMPDVEGTVFYLKNIDKLTFSWDRIEGAKKYKIYQYDLTRDNGNLSAQYSVSKDTTSFAMPILGGQEYKIELVALDSAGREGNRAQYIVERGRIVTRDLQKGCMDSVDVRMLNQKLNSFGLVTDNDISFKDNTDTAVKAVQMFSGNKINGVVGNETWYAINTLTKEINSYNQQQNYGAKQDLINRLNDCWKEMNAEKSELVYGMSNKNVEILQQKLNDLGLDTGRIDGVFGDRTLISVMALQRACGLKQDGIVGPNTWASILDQIEIKKYYNNIGKNYFNYNGRDVLNARNQIIVEIEQRKREQEQQKQQMQAVIQHQQNNSIYVPFSNDCEILYLQSQNVSLQSIIDSTALGVYNTGVSFIDGIKSVIENPEGILLLIGSIATYNVNPRSMIYVNNIVASIEDTVTTSYNEFIRGNGNVKAYYISRAGSEIFITLVGTKGVTEVSESFRIGKASDILSDTGGYARLATGRIFNISKQESKIWKNFENVKGRDRKCSGYGNDKRYYEWDFTHNDIEMYDSKGNHLGSVDPITGGIYKGAESGRRIDL